MEHAFWHRAWSDRQIGFHQPDINAQLMAYWPQLSLDEGSRVLVPLCGKSSDMLWLIQSHRVLGVELSETAVAEFFTDNGLDPCIAQETDAIRYSAPSIDLCCGDFFALPDSEIASVDGVFDRAALVALPVDIRERYVEKIASSLKSGAAILLITIEYDESVYDGPPFNIPSAEVQRLYADRFDIAEAGSNREDFKGMQVTNRAYLLRKR